SGGPLPDLVLESIEVSEIPTPQYGAVTVFDVTVRNAGNVAAGTFWIGDFDLTAFPGSFPNAVVIGSRGPGSGSSTSFPGPRWSNCQWRSREVSGGLAAGDTVTVQFWRSYRSAGPASFTAYADVCGAQT